MPQLSLTKRAIDGIEAAGGELIYWDPELRGFGLKVTARGVKSYVVQYRLGGRGARTRRFTLGQHGSPWTPATARAEAEMLLREVRKGIDVVHAKRDRQRRSRDLAFTAYLERFKSEYLLEHCAASYQNVYSTLRRFAVPVLKDKSLSDISRQDLLAVLAEAKGKVATRRNLFAFLRKLFRWAVAVGDLERSPVEGMQAPPSASKRDRVLNDAELALVMRGALDLGYPFGPLVQLLVCTGQRLEETAAADWREFDRARSLWSIPGERAKNRSANEVPLSTWSVTLLDGLAGGKKWPRKGMVFTTTGKSAVSGFSKAKARLDERMKTLGKAERRDVLPWRFHDLRRTVATGLQRLGVRFEVTEAILNHVSGAKAGVAGIYQRHGWASEKAVALQAWADHITAISSSVEGAESDVAQ